MAWFLVLLTIIGVGLGDTLTQLYATDSRPCPIFTILNNGTNTLLQDADNRFLYTANNAYFGVEVEENVVLLPTGETFSLNSYQPVSVQRSSNPFCDTSRREGYLVLYRLYLKNFEFNIFRANRITEFMFVLSTFLIIVILLNLLIAIVNINYSSSFDKATALFRRSRLVFVAELIALEAVVQPRVRRLHSDRIAESDRSDHWTHIIFKTLALISLGLTGVSWVGGMWLVGNYINETGVGVALAIIGCVPLLVLTVYLFLGWGEEDKPTTLKRNQRNKRQRSNSGLEGVALRMLLARFSGWTLGVSKEDRDVGTAPRVSEMQFRVRLLETRLEKLQKVAEETIDDKARTIRSRIGPLLTTNKKQQSKTELC